MRQIQDWTTDKTAPSYEQNGTWEDWMSFGGITCNQAFDAGYDGDVDARATYEHPALIAAYESGRRQRQIEENE